LYSYAHEVVLLLLVVVEAFILLLLVVVEAFISYCSSLCVEIPLLIAYALFVIGAAKSIYWPRWRNTWKWWMRV
jgi:type IV secretory pathway VirB6-like protein